MKVMTVKKITFDWMENRIENAICVEELATFGDDAKKNAYVKACEFIDGLEPMKLSLQWDKEVYPKIVIEERYAR